MTAKPKFIFKANDDVLSFCACEGAPAMSSGQLACPWCGCGWMISCSRCKQSFIFAEVREIDISLIELGRREAAARGFTGVTEEEIAQWAEDMAEVFAPFEVGDILVYLDGEYWRRELDRNRVRRPLRLPSPGASAARRSAGRAGASEARARGSGLLVRARAAGPGLIQLRVPVTPDACRRPDQPSRNIFSILFPRASSSISLSR